MRNKELKIILATFLVFSVGITSVSASNMHQFKQLGLRYTATNEDTVTPPSSSIWINARGNEISGFKLGISPTYTWYFVDIETINPLPPAGTYGFYLDINSVRDLAAWDAYWGSKYYEYNSILINAITHGTLPTFYLIVGATSFELIDGYFYNTAQNNPTFHYRFDGDHPLGTYVYHGTIDGKDYTLKITLR